VFESAGALWSRTPRSLKRFLLTGCTAVAIDGSTYLLLMKAGMTASIAKAFGFVVGAVFAYLAGRFWAFEDAKASNGSALPFALLYLTALAVNVLVNKLFLVLLGPSRLGYEVSWFLATGSSATLNYLGMRFVVFRRSESANA